MYVSMPHYRNVLVSCNIVSCGGLRSAHGQAGPAQWGRLTAPHSLPSGALATVQHSQHQLSHVLLALQIAQAYEAGGAACLSVLTDAKYFQGSFENLQKIRAAGVSTPLLCKEFIVEAYQLFKARASGADAVLLIAAVLPNADLAYLVKAATKCKLQVLIEVHSIPGAAMTLSLRLSNILALQVLALVSDDHCTAA